LVVTPTHFGRVGTASAAGIHQKNEGSSFVVS